MKKTGHPPYQEVLFVDTATGTKFVCGSTLQPKEREKYEGKEYPVYKVPISSASHPFFTGNQQFVDSEGQVNKFIKKYSRKEEERQKLQEKAVEESQAKGEKKGAKLAALRKSVIKGVTKKPSKG